MNVEWLLLNSPGASKDLTSHQVADLVLQTLLRRRWDSVRLT